MANCFGKYGIDELTNFDFTSSDYTIRKKNNNIYSSVRNKLDNNNNYKDRSILVKNGRLKSIKSNDEHLQLGKTQYYYYNKCTDASFVYNNYSIQVEPNFFFQAEESNVDISNAYTSPDFPIDTAILDYGQIKIDPDFTNVDLNNIEGFLLKRKHLIKHPVPIFFKDLIS